MSAGCWCGTETDKSSCSEKWCPDWGTDSVIACPVFHYLIRRCREGHKIGYRNAMIASISITVLDEHWPILGGIKARATWWVACPSSYLWLWGAACVWQRMTHLVKDDSSTSKTPNLLVANEFSLYIENLECSEKIDFGVSFLITWINVSFASVECVVISQ